MKRFIFVSISFACMRKHFSTSPCSKEVLSDGTFPTMYCSGARVHIRC